LERQGGSHIGFYGRDGLAADIGMSDGFAPGCRA
jgi:hypothetical protein